MKSIAGSAIHAPGGMASPALTFRGPSTSSAKQAAAFGSVPPDFLLGSWHVTHSTLPMWKSNRNVTITYTSLDHPPGAIDDLVCYNPLKSDKEKKVHGIDTPDPGIPAKYTWRGRNWLRFVSSKWEVLGFGDDEGGWLVTYFAKTLFTPAGIDIYSRSKHGMSLTMLERIKAELAKVEDDAFRTMADDMFKIEHD